MNILFFHAIQCTFLLFSSMHKHNCECMFPLFGLQMLKSDFDWFSVRNFDWFISVINMPSTKWKKRTEQLRRKLLGWNARMKWNKQNKN